MDGKEMLFSGKVTRRDFMKTCMVMSAAMGLPYGMHTKLADAAMSDDRPPVIWLHFQECTGCSESLIRAANPSVASLLLDMINLEYHETLMPGSGHQAEENLHEAMKRWHGKYILIAEGAVPTNDNGIYCKVGGKTAIDSLKEAAEGAAAIIAVGTCASSGGVAAAAPNPTGAKPAHEILTDKTVVNIPGCPPNTYNMTGTILYYLAFNKLPELDELNRPKWAYGRIIHEHCERRPHFDAGRFVQQYGDQAHKDGHCLFKMGCKGPVTHANCNTLKFNDMNVWPVSIGHACVGCTEPGVAFNLGMFERVQVHQPTPPDTYPSTQDPAADRPAIGPAATGVAGLVGGAVLGAAAMTAKKLPKDAESVEEHHE